MASGMDTDPEAETRPCHRCGGQADTEIHGDAWCASCLHVTGSCCAGE